MPVGNDMYMILIPVLVVIVLISIIILVYVWRSGGAGIDTEDDEDDDEHDLDGRVRKPTAGVVDKKPSGKHNAGNGDYEVLEAKLKRVGGGRYKCPECNSDFDLKGLKKHVMRKHHKRLKRL